MQVLSISRWNMLNTRVNIPGWGGERGGKGNNEQRIERNIFTVGAVVVVQVVSVLTISTDDTSSNPA